MNVYPVVPRGYCKGVVRAIAIAKKCAKEYPNQPIYILGMIVHNQYIVNALSDLGIKTIDEKGKTRMELLDQINEGVVLITAHGAGEEVFEAAQKKGLTVIDATCVDVIKTHELIKEKINEGYEILYIGKKGHPEAEGTLAIDAQSIHLIQSKADIDDFKNQKKNFVITNQTTMSLWDIYDICEYAKTALENVEIAKETCTATKIRQEAIAQLDDSVDLVIIVGDPHSNNTTRLAQIAHDKAHKEVIMIESIHDLDLEKVKGKKKIAVSSGASTPTYLTNQIIDFLKNYDEKNAAPVIPDIIASHILD